MNGESPSDRVAESGPRDRSKRRKAARLLTVFISLGLAFFIAEFALRLWTGHLVRSDRMDPGMIRRDDVLGWALNPGWNGHHAHHDFGVTYSTDSGGYRTGSPTKSLGTNSWVAVIGDSFTFGLGVNDDETFCSLLNQQSSNRHYVNFGIPGYSTDQELLLIEREILPRRPAEVLLVVYLGNDLLDLERSVPLQVSAPKPRFELKGGELILHPPDHERPPTVSDPSATTRAIIGDDKYLNGRRWLSARSAMFRLMDGQLPAQDLHGEFPNRLSSSVDLFRAILARLHEKCRSAGCTLRLVLLANSSLIHQPRSASGQYQDFIHNAVSEAATVLGIPVIDAVAPLRQSVLDGNHGRSLFHPNEGHLTPTGHRVVAHAIADGSR